jgi:hypothetical protein
MDELVKVALTYGDIVQSREPNARAAMDQFYAKVLPAINHGLREWMVTTPPPQTKTEKD